MISPSLRRLTSLLTASALAASLVVAALPAAALAAAPPAPYVNGFENAADAVTPADSGTDAMFNVTRVTSGTDGIASSSGGWHATAATNAGSFTRLGGYSSTFPVGGYTTSIDVYLDISVATGNNDLRFDWSSAVSTTAGAHRRDFVFSVGTDPANAGTFLVSASNTTPGWPGNPGRDPLTVAATGWYTFQHTFRDSGAGLLAVDLKVLSGATVLKSWTLSDPLDIIGTTVGGNRYGWLVTNGFSSLALDNVTRTSAPVAPVCTPTGLVRDTINLTAAQIGGTVTGTLDATGCNIGVYYGPGTTGSVTGANIFGADYYGVVVNAAAVNVTNSAIHDIGESPFDGAQHGVGVLYTTINQAGATTGPSATGTLSGTTITKYQKNGVVVSGRGAAVTVQNNTVTGEGPISYIAQNGIQISFGATAIVKGNTASGNWYTPADTIACGLLIFQADGVKASSNSFFDNERNQCNFGKGGGSFKP